MIKITIETDGTITTQCGKVAALDHQLADEYLHDLKLEAIEVVEGTKKHPHSHVQQKQKQGAR